MRLGRPEPTGNDGSLSNSAELHGQVCLRGGAGENIFVAVCIFAGALSGSNLSPSMGRAYRQQARLLAFFHTIHCQGGQ